MKDGMTLRVNGAVSARSVAGIALSAVVGVVITGVVFVVFDVELFLGRWMRGFEWRYRPLQWGFTAVFLFLWLWARQITARRGARAAWLVGGGLGYLAGVASYLAVAWLFDYSWDLLWDRSWHLVVAAVLMWPALTLTWLFGAVAAVVAARVARWLLQERS